jgi:hypothetical protein
LAQVFGIRRRNVDCDVGSKGVGFFEADQVVLRGAFDRRVEVLADIDAQDSAIADPRQASQQGVDAFIVEAHSVDDGLLLGQTEQARLRVAWLRARRDRADFNETEAQTSQAVDGGSVLVETGGKPDPVGKFESHGRHRGARCLAWSAKSQGSGKRKRIERQFMRAFGIEAEQQRADQGVRQHGSGFYDAGLTGFIVCCFKKSWRRGLHDENSLL